MFSREVKMTSPTSTILLSCPDKHRDTVADLIRKGKDLERLVLARAVRLHLQNRVLVYNNRTVVFE